MSSPNFVPSQSVANPESYDIKLSFLPYTSGQHLDDVFLELLHSDGPFQPVRTDPQQIALYHCRIQSGGIVSVPRARLSPPSFRRTVTGSSWEFPQLSTRRLSTVSRASAPEPQKLLEKFR